MSTKLFDINFNPNPASSWTNISYELPSMDSQAVLVIYDQYGREVKSFTLAGQSGSFTWDTRSTESGVYIYRLMVNNESIIGRILVN